MAMYVYRDNARTQKLYAKDASGEDKNTRFYCANPNCNAHMYICNVNGSSSAYFRAIYSQHGHIHNCPFHSSNDFNPDDHNEAAFDFENGVKNLMLPSSPVTSKTTPAPHHSGESKDKPLKTIRQIYDMCKSYVCTDVYNHFTIGQMLVDDRSFYMYPKGVFGYRIIEGKIFKGHFYNSDKLEIKITAPITNCAYTFLLKFQRKILFNTIRENIYANRDKIMVVAGKWKPSGTYNMFCADISSKKQITIIRQ